MIIEALVAMGIISVALVAILSLSLQSIRVQLSNRQWTQADQLQQESLEAIRQIRDGIGKIKIDEALYDWDWDADGIWGDLEEPSFFRMYYDRNHNYWILEMVNLTDPKHSDYQLYYDSSTNSFGYPNRGSFASNAKPSSFYRQIVITHRPGITHGKNVICLLNWKQGDLEHEAQINTILTQW